MSTLLKWAQNTTQGKINNKNNNTTGERKWIHPPETLQKGHIAYLVKFLGNTVVDQPKGTIETLSKLPMLILRKVLYALLVMR
ncbi:putative phosphotyrosine-binding domain, phosphotyrosine-interaction (PI) domain protein, partial [Trypoxylus dichotomus]